MRFLAAASVLAISLAACGDQTDTEIEDTAAETGEAADSAEMNGDAMTEDGMAEEDMAAGEDDSEAIVQAAQAEVDNSVAEITAEDVANRIEILASDAFEGRAPATPGGERTVEWVTQEMQRIGLEPMSDAGYTQTVPLVEATLDTAQSDFAISGPDGDISLQLGEDVVYWTKQMENEVSFEDSELVFIGYGSVAPEYDWNDYADMDWSGKTVVMLVNDPGFATEDPELFNGRAMTYYGRWTYKFEEAGRQGPDAAIIIHETEPASYGWSVVRNSWTGPQLSLETEDPKAKLEGWVTRKKAEEMFTAAGLDLEELKEQAKERGFAPVPMEGLTASGTVVSDVKRSESKNVGGVIRGSERPDEYVLYTGHWDHLGAQPADFGEDTIYNGAVDNASGTAGILEIGEKFAKRETPPARSVMILAVTAEESGLIGSDYFAQNPVVPLKDIVAGINIDAMLPDSESRDMVVIGYGSSELEDMLAEVVEPMGKTLTPDPNAEAGYYYRSDHISLAKRGVPMLYAEGGEDLIEGGTEAGEAAAADYRANAYHGVADEYDDSWDMSGIVADLKILYQLGENLADSESWPEWYDGSEFKAIREEQRASE